MVNISALGILLVLSFNSSYEVIKSDFWRDALVKEQQCFLFVAFADSTSKLESFLTMNPTNFGIFETYATMRALVGEGLQSPDTATCFEAASADAASPSKRIFRQSMSPICTMRVNALIPSISAWPEEAPSSRSVRSIFSRCSFLGS